jgi:hypothetical protein
MFHFMSDIVLPGQTLPTVVIDLKPLAEAAAPEGLVRVSQRFEFVTTGQSGVVCETRSGRIKPSNLHPTFMG